jgi:hypothetical protein
VADEPKGSTKRKKKRQAGAAIGAAIVGFEQAVFRKLPPPLEVVVQSRHDGPVAADGTMYTIALPGDGGHELRRDQGSTEPVEQEPQTAE